MLVRKFGGTSMGSVDSLTIVSKIIRSGAKKRTSRHNNAGQAIVVSAMSGVTDKLIELIKLSLAGKRQAVKKKIVKLLEHHNQAAYKLIHNPKILTGTEKYFEKVLHGLSGFLKALSEIGELSEHAQDTILAVGERLSARLLAGILTNAGLPAAQVDLEKVIPGSFKVADYRFYITAEKKIKKAFSKIIRQGKIPIGTGYFGRVPGGMLPAVGRGYSDFCAALVAAGMKAEKLEIWTDVSGVLTADPRKVKGTKILNRISFEAAAELAHFGAKVIHPQSIHPAIRANIPVWIKNTFEPKAHGTEIVREVKNPRTLMSSITSKKGITVINIASYRMLMQYGFLAKIFNIFAHHKTPIDVVSTSEVSVSVTIEGTKHLKEIVAELSPFSKVSVNHKKAIVCLVGLGMARRHGIAGEVFSILGKAGISVDLISQGASEINITFVVAETEADKAVSVLHKKFF